MPAKPKTRALKEYEAAYRGRVALMPASAVGTLLHLLVNSDTGARVRDRAAGRAGAAADWAALLAWARSNAARAGVDPSDAQAVEAWAASLRVVSASARSIAEAFTGRRNPNTGRGRLGPLVSAGLLLEAAPAQGRRAPLWVFEPVEFTRESGYEDEREPGYEDEREPGAAWLPARY